VRVRRVLQTSGESAARVPGGASDGRWYGERRLRENTNQFIFKIADVLEHFTRYVVFQPGDLIAMGAPKGTAMSQPNAAELYLKPGDRMEIAIEGLMSLRTRIVEERL